jgi:peptidoglycan glycosyltransferase
VNRQISAVALVTLVMLAALIVATTYWQSWAAPGLAAQQDNAIQRVAQFEIRRGLIYASDGKTLLAGRVRVKKKGQAETFYFRRYPTNGFASQVIGYSTASRSTAGLEQSLNDYLTGSNEDIGTIFSTLGDKLTGKTITGNNVVLNLDVKAQNIAQTALQGKCGAAVVLDPRTGAVLAMASAPTYNPNLLLQTGGYAQIQATKSPCAPEPASPLLNRATQGLFPPGSTFKTITAAAALDDRAFTPASTFNDPGYCVVYGKPVYNALDQNGPEKFGRVDFVTAYQHSINAVFCMIGQDLGALKILAEAKKFGFYQVPPLETPTDARAASGLYNPKTHRLFYPKHDYDVDAGRLAFGQERMLVTPLQMAMVASAIANNGVLMKPQLVKRIASADGKVIYRMHPKVYSHATRPVTAAEIRAMMVKVVQGGTGTNAQIPGVVVGGKTGTAETGVPNVYDAWFIFFAPAVHPVVAGAVVVEDQLNGFGGAIAAPIAKQLMQAILPAASNGST